MKTVWTKPKLCPTPASMCGRHLLPSQNGCKNVIINLAICTTYHSRMKVEAISHENGLFVPHLCWALRCNLLG